MATIPLSQTVLLVIDVQAGLRHPTYFGLERSNHTIDSNVSNLIRKCRSSSISVVHVHHHSKDEDSPLNPNTNPDGVQVEPYAAPAEGEEIFLKYVNSAFVGTDLESWLRQRKTQRLLVCGVTTDHCVSTSVRMAANLGVVRFADETEDGEILLVGDATCAHSHGTFDADTVQQVNLATLDKEFCRVVNTKDIVNEINTWRA
ncbi:MAG: hypothetical protein M1831_000370 [Alyxoria varia]|nr:MAG: hypothetical protein M1831_000370 [Alyxoria varia]